LQAISPNMHVKWQPLILELCTKSKEAVRLPDIHGILAQPQRST
jgi:hypothetical protein